MLLGFSSALSLSLVFNFARLQAKSLLLFLLLLSLSGIFFTGVIIMDRQSGSHSKNAGLSERNKTQNLPNNPPSDGKNSEPRIQIDLLSCLRSGWRTTNRRGKPGKSIVLFQGPPEAAPVNNSVPPTKKRNREEEPVEDDGKRRNPSGEKLIIMEPGASSSSGRPIPQNGVERAPESSRAAKGKAPAVTPTKQYFCSNCRKKFDSYFALGGHRAYHVRETRRWWGHQPSWAALWYGQQGVQPNYQEAVHVHQEQHGCPWCNRSFSTRQGLSAHSRFCRMRRQQEENQKPAEGRDFDLNQLPPEAFLPEEILRLTWR